MAAESLRSTLLPTTASDSAPAARSKNFPGSKYNHNVVVNWLLKVSTGMADSIWSGTVLASYLYELMGQSNSFAGYVEAAQGVASLVVALPVGWLADRGSKSRIIAIGGSSGACRKVDGISRNAAATCTPSALQSNFFDVVAEWSLRMRPSFQLHSGRVRLASLVVHSC